MKVFIAIIAVLLTTSAFSQAEGEGWYKQKSGTAARLNRVYFFNRDSGWAVGYQVWYKTTNGGNTWEYVPLPAEYSVADVINPRMAIATNNRYIKYTTDAGVTWSDSIYANINEPQLGPLHAFSLDSIFSFTQFSDWTITTNRGKSWATTKKDVPGVDEIHRVFFENSRVGYATGNLGSCEGPGHISSGICRTTDGGMTWNSICTENKILPFTEEFWGVWAKDNYIIVIGNMETILISRNAGATWDTISRVSTRELFLSVVFPTPTIGFISATSGIILKTTDAGFTWKKQRTTIEQDIDTISSIFLHDITFIDSLNGWSVGDGGIILHTINGGFTWVKQYLPKPLTTSVSPEPFGRKTSITYELPSAMKVKIRIYDVLGKELVVLESPGIQDPGTHSIEFDGSRYPEGTFHYQIQTEGFYGTGKMTKVVY
jgi:photosystem II stability/assembly factor-like uncharacterized protein